MNDHSSWGDKTLVDFYGLVSRGYVLDTRTKEELDKAHNAVLNRFAELRRQLSEMQRIINEGH